MQQLVKDLGLELTQAQVEQVGAANDGWRDMQLIATGAFRQIAAEVAPVLTVIFTQVKDTAVEFRTWTSGITTVVDTTVYLAGAFYDVFEVVDLTRSSLQKMRNLDFSGVGEGIKNAMDFGTGQKALDQLTAARQAAANAALQSKGGALDTAALEAEKEANKRAEDAANRKSTQDKLQVADRLSGMHDEVMAIGRTKDMLERLRLVRLNANDAQLAEFDSLVKLRTEREKAEEASKAGKAMTERLRSPAEQFKADMEELKQLKEANAIDQVTYLRGQREAILKRDKAEAKPEPPKIGFLQRGSVAAYSQALANEKGGAQEKANGLLAEIDATLKRLEGKPTESGLKRI